MKIKTVRRCGTALGVLFAIFVYVAIAAVSWIATCGIIKLITMCFGWTFNWAVATGIWLVMYLLKNVFSRTITVKK